MRNMPTNLAHNNHKTEGHTQQMQEHKMPNLAKTPIQAVRSNTGSGQIRSTDRHSWPNSFFFFLAKPNSAMTRATTTATSVAGLAQEKRLPGISPHAKHTPCMLFNAIRERSCQTKCQHHRTPKASKNASLSG